MVSILVAGPGCTKCQTVAKNAEEAAKALQLDYELTKVTDIRQITALGIMQTPSLIVDGSVKSSGKVPSVDEIKTWLDSSNR